MDITQEIVTYLEFQNPKTWWRKKPLYVMGVSSLKPYQGRLRSWTNVTILANLTSKVCLPWESNIGLHYDIIISWLAIDKMYVKLIQLICEGLLLTTRSR